MNRGIREKPLAASFGTPETALGKGLPDLGGVEAPPGLEGASYQLKAVSHQLKARKRGRPQAIPPEHWATVFRLYGEGNGYRRIADLLIPLGVSCTKSSVERLIKGQAPYQGRRVLLVQAGDS